MILTENNEVTPTMPNYENSVEANLARVSLTEFTSESFDIAISHS